MGISNGKDHEKAARRRAEQAQREKEGRELDRKLRETELAIARNEAKMETLREQALRDEGLREAVRVALWAKVPGRVTAEMRNGEAVLIAPRGLPDGIGKDDLDVEVVRRLELR